MFATWTDAATALAAVLAINLTVKLLVGARDGPVVVYSIAASFGFRPGKPPKQANDLWFGVVGQRREDAKRRRRALVLLLVAVAAAQALMINGYVAGGLIFCLWILLDAATRIYDKVLYVLLGEDTKSTAGMSIREELSEILATVRSSVPATNPLQGRWRPLGVASGAISLALAIVGWIALLSSFGVRFHDLVDPLAAVIGADLPVLRGIAGAGVILLARAPVDLARRYALAHPAPERHYDIVFLRSFQDDGLSIRARGDSRGIVDRLTMRHRHGYERLLVASMQHFGPVVAIGEPRERLPPMGAFRLYYEDDEWQDAVTRMLSAARFVVLSLGETPSVGWEITKLKEMNLLGRTVFLIPPVDSTARRRRLQLLMTNLGVEPTFLEETEPGVEYVGVMFQHGRPVPLASAAYDYASYYAAVLEAGIGHFDGSDEHADGVANRINAAVDSPGDYAGATVAALEAAAVRRDGWPLSTFHILCALIDTDVVSAWERVLLRATYVSTADYQLYLDRPAGIAGDWRGVPLTAHAAAALRLSAEISRKYEFGPVPPGALALGLVTDPASAASRALLDGSELFHAELISLLQRELLGAGLDGS
jgi:hypothetical protein